MSIADTIAPHLPFLRRYARALTGSQESGDKYVMGVLEVLINDPSRSLISDKPKEQLYATFTRIWQSLDVNVKSASGTMAAEDKVATLTPMPRQAFLLSTVEEFSREETARILDVSDDEVAALLNQAGREIAEQVATSVLIIEDEPIIAMDIEQMVIDLGHEVTGIARTHSEAVEQISKRSPGMVLADIQLADGSSGIDAVNDILKSVDVPVIFITAFPERLLTGERPEPAFLVTKPFQQDHVQALISQALFFEQNAGASHRQ
ncbi:MAG: response regulator [Pseudomonadota bacterium]